MAIGEPTVSSKGLRAPFLAAAARTQRPMPDLAASVGVPLTLLNDVSARVPHGTMVRVWDGLADRCGDASFGLTAAKLIGAPQLDLVDLAFARAPTVRALCECFSRYQRLLHEANQATVETSHASFVVRHAFSRPLARSRHFTEFILAMWAARLRGVTGGRLSFTAVCFQHDAPSDVALAEETFGVRVRWNAPHDELTAPIALFDEPLGGGDARVVSALETHLVGELDALDAARIPDAVRLCIVESLRASESPDVDVVARRLALSRRTLQRRLREARTSFRDVVDAARHEVALDALTRGGRDMTDVAFLLGFSELSAFSRAFRRWTGASPTSWRRPDSSSRSGS